MVQEGLIRKKKNSEDRVYVIKMLKKGEEKYHGLKRDTLDMIFSILNQKDRQNLHTALSKLLNKSRNLLGLDYKTPF
jgi:DNA-binding MarR family transcriptional regulator